MKFNGPGKSDSVLYHTSKSKANIFKRSSEFFCVRPKILSRDDDLTTQQGRCAHTLLLSGQHY